MGKGLGQPHVMGRPSVPTDRMPVYQVNESDRNPHCNFHRRKFKADCIAPGWSLSLDYKVRRDIRLQFLHSPGLHIQLRLNCEGRYAWDGCAPVSGARDEIQVYWSARPWRKDVYERRGAVSKLILFHLSEDTARHLLSDEAVLVNAEEIAPSLRFSRIPLPDGIADALDRHFLYDDSPLGELYRHANLMQMLAESLSAVSNDFAPSILPGAGLAPHDYRAIRREAACLVAEDGQYRTVAEMAAICAMSERKFSTAFARVYGMSFPQFSRRQRMRSAARKIANGMHVADAAREVGYEHTGHFAKLFRAEFGMFPSDYREQCGRTFASAVTGSQQIPS